MLAVATLFLAACEGGGDGTDAGAASAAPVAVMRVVPASLPPGVTAAMVARGEEVYESVCAPCHGPEGAGTQLGPALDDSEWIGTGGTLDTLASVIRVGVADPDSFPVPMPPLPESFTAEQLQAVAAYVYTLSHNGE